MDTDDPKPRGEVQAAKPATKRPLGGAGGGRHGSMKKARKSKRERTTTEGSSEDVLQHDMRALIGQRNPELGGPPFPIADPADLPAARAEIEVRVHALSSTGDGLGTHDGSPPSHVYVVPFSLPGDVVRARPYRHVPGEVTHSLADFLAVVTPSELRDDSRVRCRYFSSCAGCQFQMVDYAEQLRIKRRTVERAFARTFGGAAVPPVGDTIASPLQYGYRTKLTPHFTNPPGTPFRNRGGGGGKGGPQKQPEGFRQCPDFGFMIKGQRKVLDIEECPIGTEVVQRGLSRERARLGADFATYRRGATILLRESTRRQAKEEGGPAEPMAETDLVDDGGNTDAAVVHTEAGAADNKVQPSVSDPLAAAEIESGLASAAAPEDGSRDDGVAVRVEADTHTDIKTCITDPRSSATEYIGSHVFTSPAGSFFQNNNSIMPAFIAYVRDRILPPPAPAAAAPSVRYLIDAYSGSGLFTIALSSLFEASTGIDIDPASIASARGNAAANGIPPDRALFIAADAAELFRGVVYPPDETVVVLDPPRKGCDDGFLGQLLRFGPRRVVYVSCNVHTQARDVAVLAGGAGGAGARYEIESLVGFDFFPQTAHVEGVAVLNRVDGGVVGPLVGDDDDDGGRAGQGAAGADDDRVEMGAGAGGTDDDGAGGPAEPELSSR